MFSARNFTEGSRGQCSQEGLISHELDQVKPNIKWFIPSLILMPSAFLAVVVASVSPLQRLPEGASPRPALPRLALPTTTSLASQGKQTLIHLSILTSTHLRTEALWHSIRCLPMMFMYSYSLHFPQTYLSITKISVINITRQQHADTLPWINSHYARDAQTFERFPPRCAGIPYRVDDFGLKFL